MNRFERFCRKYERFGIRNLMTVIVAGQAILGVVCLMLSMSSPGSVVGILDFLSFRPERFLMGEVWRLVTFLFVPETMGNLLAGFNLIWFAVSLFFYFWVGRTLENAWGRMQLTVYYFSGVLLTAAFSLLTNTAAALFYLNLSLFFALATLMPDMQIRLYFVLPIKMKWVALVQAAIFIGLPLVQWPFGWGNLYPLLSVLNYLIFFGGTLCGLVRRAPGGIKTSQRTVRFKNEVRRAKSNRGYIHKCAVCGRTDTDCPDMEFRYCSLCSGYACYCAEHIFSHAHKTAR